MKIELRNYRCFTGQHPGILDCRDGFTAIVGANNSGKSSLLKAVYECRSLFASLSGPSDNTAAVAFGRQFQAPSFDGLLDRDEVFHDGNNEDLLIKIEFDPLEHRAANNLAHVSLRALRHQPPHWMPSPGWMGDPPPPEAGHNGFQESRYLRHGGRAWDLAPIMEAFRRLWASVYIPAFRNAINQGGGTYFDLAVGTQFIDTWHEWKTGPSKVRNRRIEAVTEDVRRLLGLARLEISASKELKTLQINTGRGNYKLQEVGAGIAELILCLGQAAVSSPSYIFIDEPELHLHPSLQVDFLTTLGSYAKHGTVFSTHSIGLARAVGDRVYVCQQRDIGSECRPIESVPNFAEFLGELGLGSYQALGFDRVLLVEGPSEVRVVQQWLRLHRAEHRVLVMPLGGDSMIGAGHEHELAEITRMNVQVFVLVDSERADAADTAPRRQAFLDTCGKLDFTAHMTERRATENYFSDRAVKAEFPSFSALGPFDRMPKPNWGKANNWRIAKQMTLEDLEGTDVGEFIARVAKG